VTEPRPVALIAGIAEGLGASLARAFAAAGYDVCGLARSERVAAAIGQTVAAAGGTYTHVCCDVTVPSAVATTLQPLSGRIAVAVYNAHALLIEPFADTSPRAFERVWRVTCFGAMAVARTVLPAMAARGSGMLIFSGATAGLRGGAKFAAFASAKFALRGLAQSLAREYGPKGVHVAHIVLDGLIEEPQSTARFGAAAVARMEPDAIAGSYLDLARQQESAWTHELDLRPFGERF
jgi:NAD(P)-dependent dehydrogenase (short-subunit alcohol dehydrogenase family)